MTGLGPVTGDVQTGVAAPLKELRPIQWNLQCSFTAAKGIAAPAGVTEYSLAPRSMSRHRS